MPSLKGTAYLSFSDIVGTSCTRSQPVLLLILSAWKVNSSNFGFTKFYEVGLPVDPRSVRRGPLAPTSSASSRFAPGVFRWHIILSADAAARRNERTGRRKDHEKKKIRHPLCGRFGCSGVGMRRECVRRGSTTEGARGEATGRKAGGEGEEEGGKEGAAGKAVWC